MDTGAIRRLAELAGLELKAGEEDRLRERLQQVLDAFAVIAEADTEGVEPSPYPLPLAARTRTDEPGEPLGPDATLANAPARREGCFLVPRVVEG